MTESESESLSQAEQDEDQEWLARAAAVQHEIEQYEWSEESWAEMEYEARDNYR